MESISSNQIDHLLTEIGKHVTTPASLVLLGGSALCLLGSERPTFDIDYVGHDLYKSELQRVIEQVAEALRIPIEAVPIDEFVPIPPGADNRRIRIGQFANIVVHVLDPYTIALSKLDRGFESDIEDILFLIVHNHITVEELEQIVNDALARAGEFDMNPQNIQAHLQTVVSLLKNG